MKAPEAPPPTYDECVSAGPIDENTEASNPDSPDSNAWSSENFRRQFAYLLSLFLVCLTIVLCNTLAVLRLPWSGKLLHNFILAIGA